MKKTFVFSTLLATILIIAAIFTSAHAMGPPPLPAGENSAFPGHVVLENGPGFKLLGSELLLEMQVYIEKSIIGDKPDPNNPEVFTFEIIANGTDFPMPGGTPGNIVTTTIEGEASGYFDFIFFYDPGKYSYTIREVAGESPNYVYDDTEYLLTVEIVEFLHGNETYYEIYWHLHKKAEGLVCTPSENECDYDEYLEVAWFNNEYKTGIEIDFEKKVTGDTPSSPEPFKFTLTAAQDYCPMPAVGTVGLVNTQTVAGAGDGNFGFLHFQNPIHSYYSYIVREVAGSSPDYTYDDTVYLMEVMIEPMGSGQDAWYLIYQTLLKKADDIECSLEEGECNHNHVYEDADSIVFSNKYTKPPGGNGGGGSGGGGSTPGTTTQPPEDQTSVNPPAGDVEGALKITKELAENQPSIVGLGSDVNYIIRVTNTYSETLSDIAVTDEIDGETHELGTIDSLPPNETEEFTFTYRVANDARPGTRIRNYAHAECPGIGKVTAYADATVSMFVEYPHLWYIRGYTDNTIRPNANISRAEIVMAFYRLLKPELKDIAAGVAFNDVGSEEWYGLAVNCLAYHEIVGGYPDGSFRPNQPITRREMAAVVSRFDQLLETNENPYSDLERSDWAYEYILSATKKGWFIGSEAGRFRPEDNITRAEFVTVANRILNRRLLLEDIPAEVHKYDDLSDSHWSYVDFIESVYTHGFNRKDGGVYENWLEILDSGLDAAYNE